MLDSNPILEVRSLSAGYRGKIIIRDLSWTLLQGDVLVIIGHNGAGKSTLLKAIFGLLPETSGEVIFRGRSIAQFSPRERIEEGLVYRPQGNRTFDALSVRENLEVGTAVLKKDRRASRLAEIVCEIPELKPLLHRLAGTLSGGEKQLLSLACALIVQPRILLLDEPSLGLSPGLVDRVFARIRQISQDTGQTLVIVEQKVRQALKIADRVIVLRSGKITYHGQARELSDDLQLKKVYF